jgi:hypothetical protein
MTLHHQNGYSAYYMHSSKLLLASRVSFYVRKQMFRFFMEIMRPTEATSILDIGVTCDRTQQESNYFEQFYPYKKNIVCAGIEDGSHLQHQYPGVVFVPLQAGQPLPFSDKQFDISFCSAVIEHTGNRKEQQVFVREMLRVSQHFFLTTPNRWFPVEMHTGLPLLHYLPVDCYRAILAKTKFRYWSYEKNLNLLDIENLRRLFLPYVVANLVKIRLLGIPSNLVAYGKSTG